MRKDDTFRVKGIPLDWDADQLQSASNEQDGAALPTVKSLALETHGRSLSATVNFESLPNSMKALNRERSWNIHLPNNSAPLSLDDNFYGMTTIFAPPAEHHKVDVVAISGLGGHAFGSFKKRGGNFMWLRDALPFDLGDETTNGPMARVLIYGYNSKVANSHSIQNLEDLATAFHAGLRQVVDNQKRPIILIAHSLGGLVVKQVLITLSQSQDVKDQQIFQSTYGMAFCGVPRHGMNIQSLILIAKDGHNRFLIESLNNMQPQILRRQHQDFLKALSSESKSEIVCFYETLMSPTTEQDINGEWEMTGPEALLVTRESATTCRPWEAGPEYACAINRSHSELVKFNHHDADYENVCERLRGLAHRAVAASKGRPELRTSILPRFFESHINVNNLLVEKTCLPAFKILSSAITLLRR
ncbi:hypothetical protein VHEMI03143 [[Torrubiella] hemipterigena]|uniref:DUF676 domain-containing protein n=1 Tax=[Torrubiella] hemipterigena TaxID=1531966 RepID=A0A0A1TA14_9HYPO|nr:hypothetical protein VHEMI03143 [[Torrubiella] hemipterigena]